MIFKIALLPIGAVYLFFFFQNYLGIYVTSIASPSVYSGLLTLSCLTICLSQPLCASWIARKHYPDVIRLVLLCLMSGYVLLSCRWLLALIAGTLLVSVAEMLLFLKTDLELTDQLAEAPALAFGIQRFLFLQELAH